MAVQTFNDVVAALKLGTTWGTAGDVTSAGVNLYASAITLSGGFGDFLTRDFGQGGKRTNNARLAGTFDVTITADLTYGQGWLTLLSGLFGTESSPSETTGGQADYTCNIDVADSTFGLFWTLLFSIETDRVMEIASLKPVSMTLTQDINAAGTVSFQCIARDIAISSTNTVAEITALTDYPYETATLGGTNHYFRMDSYSTTTALTNADDKAISGFTFTLSRPHQRRYGLQGANTPYTYEPQQLGPIDATLTARFIELDNASWDLFGEWVTPAFKMAEIFFDGSQIGSGVNRSYKFRFPYLKIKGAIPPGHDVQSNNGLFLPSATWDCLKASSAPSGMSGSTDICRVIPIFPTRSTKWQA